MKIYLAGPMRGIPNFNFPAFDYAADLLRKEGHEVFSPAEHDRAVYGDGIADNTSGSEREAVEKHGFAIRDALAADLRWICLYADGMALMPGWEKSKGAVAEASVAAALGLFIITLGSRYVRTAD